MTKEKKIEHEVLGIYIKVKCPVTNKITTIKVSCYDFHASEQECEICGSHGSKSVDFTCPKCKQYHTYIINSW